MIRAGQIFRGTALTLITRLFVFGQMVFAGQTVPAVQSALHSTDLASKSNHEAKWSWVGPEGQALPFQSREEVEAFLSTATVVSMKRIGEGITNPRRVLLEKYGIQMYAVFRDVRVETKQMELRNGITKYFFRDDARFECAAYELSKLLGFAKIPPTVERNIGGEAGTLQAWVEGAMTHKSMKKKAIQPPAGGLDGWQWNMDWQLVYFFDNLIYNEDRNAGNILIEPGWKLWMIDHTRAFRRWKLLPSPEKIRYSERGVWEKLQTLDEQVVRDRLQGFLNRYEVDGLMERVALLVDHIERLIALHGTSGVLFTFR